MKGMRIDFLIIKQIKTLLSLFFFFYTSKRSYRYLER